MKTPGAWEKISLSRKKALEDAQNAALFEQFNAPMPQESAPVATPLVPPRMAAPAPADPRILQQMPIEEIAKEANALSASQTPHDPKSGTHQGASINRDTKSNITENRATWADPAMIQSFTGAITDLPSFQAQEEGQKRLEEMLAMEAGAPPPRSAYWTKPLAGLADYMNAKRGISTSNAANVPAEETPEARNMKLMDYANKLQKDRSDYNARLLDSAKAFKSGSIQEQLMQQLAQKVEAGTGSGKGVRAGSGGLTPNQWANQVRYGMSKSDDAIGQITGMQQSLAAGVPLDMNRLKIIRASLDAHGRPNMAEISAETGDPRLAEKIKQAWEKLVGGGGLTEQNRKEYEQSFQIVSDHAGVFRKIQAKRLKDMGLKGGIDPQFVGATLPEAYSDLGKTYKADMPKESKSALMQMAEAWMAKDKKAKDTNGGK